MRKIGILSAALLGATPLAANNAVGQTYLTTRDVFQATSPERVTLDRNDRMYMKDYGYGGDLSATVIYSKTTDEQALRDYFLPFIGKQSLIAGELGSDAYVNIPGTANVVANYFNVFTNGVTNGSGDFPYLVFQSELAFAPSQRIEAIGLQWQQSFKKYFIKISAPIEHITNNLGMVETIINPGVPSGSASSSGVPTGAVANMTEAFRQSGMNYGKIDGKQEKWGVADVEFMFGRNWDEDQHCQMDIYLGLVFPTGNRPKAEYLFEAVVGNNHHWGAFFGGSSRHTWREGDNYLISAYCDADARYLFENTQTRMIDLNGRPWSRYIWLADTQGTSPLTNGLSMFDQGLVFGVNVLTQQVRVAPHGSFTLNSALNYRRDCGFEIEAGANFYARQTEHVKLLNSFTNPNNYGIPQLGTDLGTGFFTTTVTDFASIDNAQEQHNYDLNHSTSNAQTIVLTESDLNLDSASNPAVLETSFYAVLGKSWNDIRYPAFAGIGGSYTYNNDNSSPRRFALWGKAGFSF